MANDLLEKPAKQHATLFLVQWHLAVARYTDWTEDVISGGDTFASEPRIGIRLPRESGGVNERPATLTWPTTLAPADTLTSQGVHAEVSVLVTEVLPGDDSTLATLYLGWVTRARKGQRGNKNLATLQLQSIKDRLRSPLGIPALRTCAWRFGDANCQKLVVPDLQETGNIDTLTDDVATISGVTYALENYWMRGYLEVNGERIAIRRYDTPDVFYLARRPPPDWVGQSVLCTPGCDKTVSVCKERWANLENFGGLGFKMPPRHPIIELPSVGFQTISSNLSPLTQIPGLSAIYDVYAGVRRNLNSSLVSGPAGEPKSQHKFIQDIVDTGWNTTSHGDWDYRAAFWDDSSGNNPAKRIQMITSAGEKPRFVRGTNIGASGITPTDTGAECSPVGWPWNPGGGRWMCRGWDLTTSLPSGCSSSFRWNRAYFLGHRDPGFFSNLNLNLLISIGGGRFRETSQPNPYQYHDNIAGLTFLAVCRNRCFQTVFYLTDPTEINIVTFHETHGSNIFHSHGSWQMTMAGVAVQNGESGSPTEMTVDSVLAISAPSASPVGLNWRVCGVRVTPGGQIESFTSSQVSAYSIIDSAAAPVVMAPATGYTAMGDHLECACLVMYERAISDQELGSAVAHLESRFSVYHPPV